MTYRSIPVLIFKLVVNFYQNYVSFFLLLVYIERIFQLKRSFVNVLLWIKEITQNFLLFIMFIILFCVLWKCYSILFSAIFSDNKISWIYMYIISNHKDYWQICMLQEFFASFQYHLSLLSLIHVQSSRKRFGITSQWLHRFTSPRKTELDGIYTLYAISGKQYSIKTCVWVNKCTLIIFSCN